MANAPASTIPVSVNGAPKLPGQVVLVMQGGGALGAYQGGVYEALHERRQLLHNAPHLVWPLRFLVPLYRGARVPAWKMRLGLLLYDVLAGRGNLRRSRSRSLSRLIAELPMLRRAALAGGLEYADAGMDDARLAVEVAATAADAGAVVANYVEAVGFEPGAVRAVDRLEDLASVRRLMEVLRESKMESAPKRAAHA